METKQPWIVITIALMLLGMSLTADGAGRLNWQAPISTGQRIWNGAKIISNLDVSKINVANRQPAPEPSPTPTLERGEGRTIDEVYEDMKDE